MIQAAENYILCEIEKKFQDTNGGLFIDTTWQPEEYSTLEGIVVSPPARIKSDRHRKITGTVNKGDKIFFSYSVIFEKLLQPDEDTPVYKNLVLFEGKEYWKVDMGEVFCTISDKINMVTENLLIEPIDDESGTVIGMPNINLSCNVRDVVCFEPRFVQKYNILGKEHYILPSRRIIAKKCN
jgi:co-chaperonin GroES (HSP10)